jgi:hypothetical protein
MGRSDEPQLEELSKLLRRLETMEVAPKHDSSHKHEPEQPHAEYVGALRGAAPARGPDEGHGTTYAKGREAQTAVRSGGNSAIIVGATTAALVSSIVAVGLLLLTSGGQKDGDRRLTFYAPVEPSAAVRTLETAPQTQPANVPAGLGTDIQPLLQRADYYLRSGNPDQARLALEQAAHLGSGVAALTLGAMYDPGRAAQFANLGLKSDTNVARAWYERAKTLGVAEANARLAELAAK